MKKLLVILVGLLLSVSLSACATKQQGPVKVKCPECGIEYYHDIVQE